MRFRGRWTTRLGFYLAAVGSAFGLGNLWRFPYVVAENGGGAFVLLYVFLAFLVGVPILVAELILGKSTQQSVMGALRKTLTVRPGGVAAFRYIGKLAVFTSLVVLGYYAVISGWVLHFFMQFVVGLVEGESFQSLAALQSLQDSGWLQVALASVHILVTGIIVMRGVQNGLEKCVGYTMPVFTILLLVLIVKSLSLPTSEQALRFLFYPDFSRLTVASPGQALGHVFFTLSVGFGIMVTFGSYMKKEVKVVEAGVRVAVLDTGISLLVGLLIFPVILAATQVSSGPELLFATLPELFLVTAGGAWFGSAFFLCLYLASLTASIGLLEAIVSNLGDRWGFNRKRAAVIGGGLSFFVAVIPAFSSTVFAKVSWAGMSVLEMTDAILINWLLPVVALGLCFIVARYVKKETKDQEFLSQRGPENSALYGNWLTVINWLGPLVIVVALVLQLYGLLSAKS